MGGLAPSPTSESPLVNHLSSLPLPLYLPLPPPLLSYRITSVLRPSPSPPLALHTHAHAHQHTPRSSVLRPSLPLPLSPSISLLPPPLRSCSPPVLAPLVLFASDRRAMQPLSRPCAFPRVRFPPSVLPPLRRPARPFSTPRSRRRPRRHSLEHAHRTTKGHGHEKRSKTCIFHSELPPFFIPSRRTRSNLRADTRARPPKAARAAAHAHIRTGAPASTVWWCSALTFSWSSTCTAAHAHIRTAARARSQSHPGSAAAGCHSHTIQKQTRARAHTHTHAPIHPSVTSRRLQHSTVRTRKRAKTHTYARAHTHTHTRAHTSTHLGPSAGGGGGSVAAAGGGGLEEALLVALALLLAPKARRRINYTEKYYIIIILYNIIDALHCSWRPRHAAASATCGRIIEYGYARNRMM